MCDRPGIIPRLETLKDIHYAISTDVDKADIESVISIESCTNDGA